MLTIEQIPIEKIQPAAYNPRKDLKPGDAEYERLARCINEFDCVEPLVWNRRTGNLVGGHQRFKILLARGDTTVACSVVDLSLEREKALNVALNKISGDWDENKLAQLLDELVRVPNFNVELSGFDLPDASKLIDRLLHTESDDDAFDTEVELEQIGEPQTKLGDIIELGLHHVICGDSTDSSVVSKLMGERKASLIFTDPPYAVDYEGGAIGKDRTANENHWDSMSDETYFELLSTAFSLGYRFSDDTAALYTWFASTKIDTVIKTLTASQWEKRNLIVWVKNTFAGGLFAQYKHRYEPCFYCFKKGKSTKWSGPNNETTVWECDKPHRNLGHPTIKPLALALRALRNSSAAGDIVLDMFLGSGTTLIAANRMGRICYGIEREPRYCDLIRKRYERETTCGVKS